MADKYRIAVATTDGVNVNLHFGHCTRFFIYSLDESGVLEKVGERETERGCSCGKHDASQLSENMKKLGDCRYLLVEKIGALPAAEGERIGIVSMELPMPIDEAVKKIISYEQIQSLFER